MKTLIPKILLTLLATSLILITFPIILMYKTYEDLDLQIDF